MLSKIKRLPASKHPPAKPEVLRFQLAVVFPFALSVCWSTPLDPCDAPQSITSAIFSVDVKSLGPAFNVEFVGNASRLNAFLGVTTGSDLIHSKGLSADSLPKGALKLHYPYARRLRIGNLFFGYECSGADFQELAVRDVTGAIHYQFSETIRLIEILLKGGLKPQLALTGMPRALVPLGEQVISHPVYGCVNAPAVDWEKTEPRERVRDWWQLQDAFMQALIGHFGMDEVKTWEFATWTEPLNPAGKTDAHLVLPESIIKTGRHDQAVAAILAASIDVAISNGLPIHIGNFSGMVEQDYPKIIREIRRFPKGEAYLKYIEGYAISRYRVKPAQNIGDMLDSAFLLLNNPEMPNKPLFIDEFGELVGNDGLAPFGPDPSLQNAEFVGVVLARVFDRQDGTTREPKRITFWNNYITPRAKNAFTRFDDYLKTPATHLIAMFASLNGYNKLNVSGDSGRVVAGGKSGTVKVILLAGSSMSRKSNLHSYQQAVDSNIIEIRGLASNTSYKVTSSTIDENNGNPISIFLGNARDYRLDPQHHFMSDGKKWTFASSYWEHCFFDEIKACAWREHAHRADSPVLQLQLLRTNENGTLRIPKNMVGVAAVMFDVVEGLD